MKKRITAFIAGAALTFSAVTAPMQTFAYDSIAENEMVLTADYSGECGENLTWTLDGGTLTISGSGDMDDYMMIFSLAPWSDYRSAITDIIIPDGVTTIGDYAFMSCLNLTSLTIPDSVTSIGNGAFSCCESLTSLTIPDSVTSIGDRAFEGTPWLEAKRAENPLVIVNNLLIDIQTAEGDVIIPYGVTSIGDGAFRYCESLTSMTIPDSVTSIGAWAFDSCTSLKLVTINNPNCEIYDEKYTISNTAAIYGYTSSKAEAYANKYDRTFVSLGDAPMVTGDINGDGTIDISDATIILMMYAYSAAGMDMSEYTEEQLIAADIDGDGKVSISDATYILTYYAQNAAGMNPSWDDILKQ